jgi:hypothetical protein
MKTSIKIPEKLVDAIDYLVNSADDEGCGGGLVVVDMEYFLDLVKVCQELGLDRIVTHIEEDKDY